MEKMLIIVVDASKELAKYWEDIKLILESIVRKFCEKHASTSSDPFGGRYNLNLVVTANEDGFVAQSAPQFDWPQSMDSFLDSLSRLNFNEYGYQGTSRIIEGISKALMMFPSTRNRTQTELMGKRHCVLVTTSHPYPVPQEVLVPTNQILEPGEVVEVTIGTVLADVERMAQSLAESFISLSVICPRDIPTIKDTFYIANQSLGSSTSNLNHPQLLLLISKQFPDAREALKQFEKRNNDDINMQDDVFDYIVENLSVQDLMLLQNMISDPLMEQQNGAQQNDAMEISTSSYDKVDGFLCDHFPEGNANGTMWFPNEILCNNSTVQQGSHTFMQQKSNSIMQQGNPSEYLMDEKNVVGGSIMITPKERERFNTLISNNLWSSEEAPSKFSLGSSTGMNPNHGHTTMTTNHLINSQMKECSGRFMEIPHPEGTNVIGSAHQFSQRTIANAPNNTLHFSTPWLERHDPNGQFLKASHSNALARANFLQHPNQDDQTHNLLNSMNNLQHNTSPVASLFNGGNGTNTSSSVLVSPASSSCVVDSSRILSSTMQLKFSGATSARKDARSSKIVPSTKNNTQVTRHNVSEMMNVSGLNVQTINIHSSQMTGINTNCMRDVVLSSNTPISAMSVGATKSALPEGSSYSKKRKSAKDASLTKSKNSKTINAQSSNENLPQMNLSSEAPSDGIKVWEGSISSRGSGVTVFVSRLVAYRKPYDSEKMFENWPNALQLNHFVSLDKISNGQIQTTRRYLHFSVLEQCPTWDNMRSKNLCAYIYLHGKTLILWIASNNTRLMGTLYDGVIPVHSHQIFTPNW